MFKKALITGINGQIGNFLTRELVDKVEIHGIVRRHSEVSSQDSRIHDLKDKITLHYGDLTDKSSLEQIIDCVKPDYIYNMAAMSHVWVSNKTPISTLEINTIGVLNLLETVRDIVPKCRVLQSSSSEMYGNNIEENGYQNENTRMDGVSIYGISKTAAYHLIRYYRKAYGMFCCNSICYNNESSVRSDNFVTKKVVLGALRIKAGLQNKLFLGNLDSSRDWSFSGDVAKAMILIINHTEPDDFVVASGETRTVREFCDIVFSRLGMDYRDYVEVDPKYYRPLELHVLKGDATKIKTVLGWKPEYSFDDLVDEMIDGNRYILTEMQYNGAKLGI